MSQGQKESSLSLQAQAAQGPASIQQVLNKCWLDSVASYGSLTKQMKPD